MDPLLVVLLAFSWLLSETFAQSSSTIGGLSGSHTNIPRWCGKWVVGMDGYKDGVVGAKSKNLAGEYSLLYVPTQ